MVAQLISLLATLGLSLRGPPTNEVRRLLSQRGVDTAGVYERDELLRLLREIGGEEQSAPPLPPVATMHVQDVMEELAARGVFVDVLTPDATLYDRLREARERGPRAASRSTPSQVRRPSSAAGTTPGSAGSVGIENIWDAAKPAWDTAQRELFPFLADTVGAAVEQVKPVAQTAVTAAAKPRERFVQAARARLQMVKLPPKPVLLAICVGALRFGVVRTALTAVSVKLTLDIAREVVTSARSADRDTDPQLERDNSSPPSDADGVDDGIDDEFLDGLRP